MPAAPSLLRNLTKRAVKSALEVTLPLAEGLTGFKTAPGDYLPNRLKILIGCYENDELVLMQRFLRPEQTIIDVGANVGYLSRFFAKRVGRNGKVYSLEPNPAILPLLRKNVSRFKNVSIHDVGMSSRSGEERLFLAGNNHSVASFARHYPATHLAYQENKSLASIAVPVIRGDEFVARENIDRVDIIKIDVEGWELNVLEGFEQTIRAPHPITLFCEFNPAAQRCAGREPEELLNWLRDRNFTLSYPAGEELRPLPSSSFHEWGANHDPSGFTTIFATRS